MKTILTLLGCASFCLSAAAYAVPSPDRETEWPDEWIAGPAKICYGGVSLTLKDGESAQFPIFEPIHPSILIFGYAPSTGYIRNTDGQFFVYWPGNARDMNEAGLNLKNNSIIEVIPNQRDSGERIVVKPKKPRPLAIRPELMNDPEFVADLKDEQAPSGPDVLQQMAISFETGKQKEAENLLSRFIIEPVLTNDCQGPKWPTELPDSDEQK